MAFTVVPYEGDSPFEPWPSLAQAAKLLYPKGSANLKGGAGSTAETIFFYDVPPETAGAMPSNNAPLPNMVPPPVFMLIHGLGDEADSFRHLIPLLGKGRYRVLALDLPGFGRSAAPGRINIKRHADAVLKLIDAACPGEAVFLAGNSIGAAVAEAAAFKRPNQIRGLVLIDGTIPGGPENPGLFALVKLLFSKKGYRSFRERPEAAWASLYPYYADLDNMPLEDRVFLRHRVMARVESKTQERSFFATQRSIVAAFTMASSFARKIRRYNGKIFLIWGEEDRIIPLSSTNAFRAIRSDAELAVISGAGHLPHQEKPEETARLMAEFLDRAYEMD